MTKSWRQSDFVPGRQYRAQQSVNTAMGSCIDGDVLVFVSESYSRYDSATVYVFELKSGRQVHFLWPDDEPPLSAHLREES